MAIKIILFGLPGSGKDTQAESLAGKFGIPTFSAGDLLRKEARSGSELGRLIAPYLERGEIVPNGVAGNIMRLQIQDPNVQRTGYVSVNYPRSRDSFKRYLEWDHPTAVIILDVPDETARQRLLARGRSDDTEETIARRIKNYRETNVPLYEWLNTTDIPTFHFDGTKSAETITDEIKKVVSQISGVWIDSRRLFC